MSWIWLQMSTARRFWRCWPQKLRMPRILKTFATHYSLLCRQAAKHYDLLARLITTSYSHQTTVYLVTYSANNFFSFTPSIGSSWSGPNLSWSRPNSCRLLSQRPRRLQHGKDYSLSGHLNLLILQTIVSFPPHCQHGEGFDFRPCPNNPPQESTSRAAW